MTTGEDLSPLGFGYKITKTTSDGDSQPFYVNDLIVEKFLTPSEVIWDSPFTGRRVLSVAIGSSHLVASATGAGGYGQLYTSGLNGCFQLGHGDNKSRHKMTLVWYTLIFHGLCVSRLPLHFTCSIRSRV